MSAPADRRPRRAVTLAITSGKGGVGKTNVTVNLAVALARLNHRVAILDADFGLGNVDVLLGLAPTCHLGHLLTGDYDIADIVVEGPAGVRIVPASSGLRELTALAPVHWERLNAGLDVLVGTVDFLLIDTAAGISSNVVDVVLGAERVLIVTSPEPTAVVDAYAMVKVLTVSSADLELGVLINGVRDAGEGELIFKQLDVAATRFLQRQLRYYGFVANDPAVRQAVIQQRPVIDLQPQAEASRCFRILAARIAGMSPGGGTGLRLVPKSSRRAVIGSTGTEAPQCA